jgi:hypothetical protein
VWPGPEREEAVEVDGDLVGAYAWFKVGRRDSGIPQGDRDIIAHLLERIREARDGETPIPLADMPIGCTPASKSCRVDSAA